MTTHKFVTALTALFFGAVAALPATSYAQAAGEVLGGSDVVLPDPDLSSPIYNQPRALHDNPPRATQGSRPRSKYDSQPRQEYGWTVQRDPLHPGENIYVKESATYRVPFNMTDSEKMLAVTVAGATILAFATERDMLDFVQKNDGKVADRIANFAEPFGGPKVGLALLAGGTYAAVAQDGEALRFYSLAIKSGVITKLLTDAGKTITRRALPNETNDPFQRSSKNSVAAWGTPSSHASTAFSLATVIAETYGRERSYISVLAYGTATATAWSRPYQNKHWVSEVILGAFLGHIVGKNVVRADTTRGGFDITPYFSHRAVGVHVTYTNEGPYPSQPRACDRFEQRPRGLEECFAAHFRP